MANPFRNVVYLQIRRGWISFRVLTWSGGDFRWEGLPEARIVVRKKGERVAVDPFSRPDDGYLFTPFTHPRVLIHNVDDTERVLRLALKRTGLRRMVARPLFMVHLRDPLDGGLSDIEHRALFELTQRLGAAGFLLLNGPYELPAPEVLRIARAKNPAAAATDMVPHA